MGHRLDVAGLAPEHTAQLLHHQLFVKTGAALNEVRAETVTLKPGETRTVLYLYSLPKDTKQADLTFGKDLTVPVQIPVSK